MTREELLTRIDDEGEFLVQYFDSRPIIHSALRAVVELHHESNHKCWHCYMEYPCSTIETIEKEITHG